MKNTLLGEINTEEGKHQLDGYVIAREHRLKDSIYFSLADKKTDDGIQVNTRGIKKEDKENN